MTYFWKTQLYSEGGDLIVEGPDIVSAITELSEFVFTFDPRPDDDSGLATIPDSRPDQDSSTPDTDFDTSDAVPNVFDLPPGISFNPPNFTRSLLKQAYEFCIPNNPELLAYWDRVEDRLYRIRNCLNISGVRRQLALFAPEIDPRLLVRARAVGLSLEDVLNSVSGNLPPYRFSFLIVKAKEYVGALQAFGAALLGAIEKKDAEELARLRLVHQDTILKLTARLPRSGS